jgi:hypothetical protein
MALTARSGTDAGFMFSVFTRFKVSGAALQSMLRSPQGPVGQRMLAQALAIKATAQEHCPVETEESVARNRSSGNEGMGPRYAGRLRDSIDVFREEDSRNALIWMIGSPLPYAARIEFHPVIGGWLRSALHTHAEVPHLGSRFVSSSRFAGRFAA